MLKTLLFGVSLLLSAGAAAQDKPKPLDLKFHPKLRMMTYSVILPVTKETPALQSQGIRKDIFLPAAQWTESGVTYTTGIIPRKFVFRMNW